MEIRGREVMHHTVIRSVRPVDLRRMRIFRTVQSAANRCKAGKSKRVMAAVEARDGYRNLSYWARMREQ